MSSSKKSDLLLISSSFFGYVNHIINSIEARGRTVLHFEDRPGVDVLTKGLLRLWPALIQKKSDSYFDQIICIAKQHTIRDVLVIKGEALSTKTLSKMREALPGARFTIYFWDGYKNMPADTREKVDYFDRAFSFDPLDVAQDNRLIYRPLFYLDSYAALGDSKDQDIDFLFLGTAHSDRYSVLKRIKKSLTPKARYKYILYMRSKILYYILKIFHPSYWFSKKEEFIFNSLPMEQVTELIKRSKVVIDIERKTQSGYTMRTIEMLGANKKLITTNKAIIKAEFYNPNNQLYIDRRNPRIPNNFHSAESTAVVNEILKKYSLQGWVDEILA